MNYDVVATKPPEIRRAQTNQHNGELVHDETSSQIQQSRAPTNHDVAKMPTSAKKQPTTTSSTMSSSSTTTLFSDLAEKQLTPVDMYPDLIENVHFRRLKNSTKSMYLTDFHVVDA